jgi:hypothetical protein
VDEVFAGAGNSSLTSAELKPLKKNALYFTAFCSVKSNSKTIS